MRGEFKIDVKNLNIWFGKTHVIKNVNLGIKPRTITAIMGPSGCGKTTFLRALNRLNELICGSKTTGEIFVDKNNIYDRDIDLYELRRRVGMVFQKPNPFPKSIYDNIAFGPKLHGIESDEESKRIVEKSLREAALWDEVKDRLKKDALDLSGGQQQRLCIARALAVQPEVILMDEPCSALDPIATAKIETLMRTLAEKYTVIIVTHNMQQASRVSDYTVFLYLGKLVEYEDTESVFETPQHELTEKYITGEFG
jgi:phosphate transport system ATP-binding protein